MESNCRDPEDYMIKFVFPESFHFVKLKDRKLKA
jgi:hypothetical protein